MQLLHKMIGIGLFFIQLRIQRFPLLEECLPTGIVMIDFLLNQRENWIAR